MASLHHLKNRPSPWVLQWRDESGKQHSKSFKRSSDAEAHKELIEASHGRVVDPVPVWVASQLYLAEVESTCAKTTLAHYLHVLRKLADDIGRLTAVDRITPEYLAKYRDRLAVRLAAKSVKNHMISIRAFCSFLIRKGWLHANPVKEVKLPRTKSKIPRWLSDAECQRLVVALTDAPPVIRLALMFALRGGLRLGDLAGLRWEDIREGCIMVQQGKSKHPRIVPLHPDIAALLKDWPRKCDYIFPARVHALARANTNALGNKCRAWLKKNRFSAGVHSLRHTAATQLAEAGATMTDLKQLLGHTSSTTTEIYLHSSRSRQSELIARLGRHQNQLTVLPNENAG
jgi:integrase/recombinase XerC